MITTNQTAFDTDERYLQVTASINLATLFLDTSVSHTVLAGGDFFDSDDQTTNDVVTSAGRRLVFGTSLFSDEHILIDNDIECGWTSTELAGVGGAFGTSPSIEITFSSRTIEQLRVYGDDAWEEYPVDFTIDLYYSGSYHNEVTKTSNTDVDYSYDLPTARTAVTKAKLTISKWSDATRPSKIHEFSFSRSVVLNNSDILSLSVLEEDNYDSGTLPIGKLSANQLALTFENNDDIDLSEMRINKSVSASMTATYDSVEYSVNMGKYYISEWSIDTLNNTLSVVAFDITTALIGDEFNTVVNTNDTAYDIVGDILSGSSIPSSLYSIDTELDDFTIPKTLFGKITRYEALSIVVSAVLGAAYVDRDTGILTILGPTLAAGSAVSLKIFSNSSTVLNGTYLPVKLDEIATVVNVEWYELVTGAADDVIESTETLAVAGGGTLDVILEYPEIYETVTSISPGFTQSDSDITITSHDDYTWGVILHFSNAGGASQDIESITINGTPVTSIVHTKTASDTDAIDDYGRITYTYKNKLIQTSDRAATIASAIVNSYSDPTNIIVSQLWGAPYVVVGDTVTVPSLSGTEDVKVERQEIKYNDSGFSHKMTSRII